MDYSYAMENRDLARIDKLNKLTNKETFWDDVRRLTRYITSDHAIGRWQCLAENRYKELTTPKVKEINYMENLTREQTIIEHRKMWNWIADNLGKTTETVYDLKRRYCKERDLNITENCFCCNYTKFDCDNCPLYWGSENNDSDTYCESKIENAINWYEAEELCLKEKFGEAAEIARKIANLPEKVYQNKECGNIHLDFNEMVKEAMELYDIGNPTNVNDWREYYEVKPLL